MSSCRHVVIRAHTRARRALQEVDERPVNLLTIDTSGGPAPTIHDLAHVKVCRWMGGRSARSLRLSRRRRRLRDADAAGTQENFDAVRRDFITTQAQARFMEAVGGPEPFACLDGNGAAASALGVCARARASPQCVMLTREPQ